MDLGVMRSQFPPDTKIALVINTWCLVICLLLEPLVMKESLLLRSAVFIYRTLVDRELFDLKSVFTHNF